MKNVVKAFSVAIIALFAMIMLPSVNAFASTANGTCGVAGGDNVTWELAGGVLTISGTGEMADYESSSAVPWNSYKTDIKSVVVSEGVENIGAYAFFDLTSMESATIAGSVTSIGRVAFMRCEKLKNVTFQDGIELTDIGEKCFALCYALESIVIPSTVENIGEAVFTQCKVVEIEVDEKNESFASFKGALYSKDMKTLITAAGAGAFEGFEIASETVTINEEAFYKATITEITIPKGVTTIGRYAFRSSDVKTVSFEAGSKIESIGYAMFYECSDLLSITIPEDVTSIGESAFVYCYRLSSITIPESVTSVGSSAFSSCSSLKTIIVLSSQMSTGSRCFEYCSPDLVIYPDEANYNINSWGTYCVGSVLTFIENEDTIALKVKETSSTNIEIPERINGIRVTSLSFAEGISTDNITIECETCYKTDSSYDEEGHFDVCGVCKGEVDKENHSFGDGDDACKCGYVPYTVKSVSDALATTYGSTKGQTLSVDVDTTLGTEVVTYKWYLDGVELEGATSDAYVIPDNMKAGTYTYRVEMSSNDYSVTEDIVVNVSKKKITAKLDNKEKIAGEANPEFTYTVSGVVEGDTTKDWIVKYTTTATNASKAGSYKIEAVITSDNYDVTVEAGTLTVKAVVVPDKEDTKPAVPKKGAKIKDAKKLAWYKVTKAGTRTGKVGTVTYLKPVNKKKTTVTIPATITVNGIKYKVTGIAKDAFKNNKYIKKITIGKEIKTIGANAFYKCTKLKNLVIKSKNLKLKNVGKKAFKGINSKAVIKVPKSKYKAYKNILTKRGVGKKVKIKKM